MHRSRLCAILVDCSPNTMDATTKFWSGALGKKAKYPDDPTDPYVDLEGGTGGLIFALQRVDDTSRIHLDIETDDVEAEVQRLEKLGAERVAQIESWWVMRDPSGHLFCVVRIQSQNFLENAQVWE